METIISPSLLSADFSRLGEEIEMLNKSEAEWIHCDIMDGVFVPNISFGFPVLKSITGMCKKALDVHLMIVHPEKFVQQVADLGAMLMNVHQEACPHLHRVVQQIHQAGMKAGVTLNPATPVNTLEEIIGDVDLVMLMGVNPGFGGQKFIESTVNKVRKVRSLIQQSGSQALIEVDGGVNAQTAPLLIEAGTDVLVSGNYIFKSANPIQTIHELKQLHR